MDNGAPHDDPFGRDLGLCANYMFYSGIEFSGVLQAQLREYLNFMFKGLFPFGEEDYFDREFNGTMYECPKRLVFVKRIIENGAP